MNAGWMVKWNVKNSRVFFSFHNLPMHLATIPEYRREGEGKHYQFKKNMCSVSFSFTVVAYYSLNLLR
jgi:hypothetical protein